jgi:hypothetical protein
LTLFAEESDAETMKVGRGEGSLGLAVQQQQRQLLFIQQQQAIQEASQLLQALC